MSFEIKMESGVLHIKIGGRFDFSVHKQFRDATSQALTNVKKIEVDLSSADYLDSSALGMLLILRDKMSGSKGSVVIKGATTDVKKILQIANFDKIFTIS